MTPAQQAEAILSIVDRLASAADEHPKRLVEISKETFVEAVVKPLASLMFDLRAIPDRNAILDEVTTAISETPTFGDQHTLVYRSAVLLKLLGLREIV